MRPGLAWLSMPKLDVVERTRVMSVTLKLADEDAAVVGSILKAFAEARASFGRQDDAHKDFYNRMVRSAGSRTVEHINDIAGAFQIAVRANQR